MCLTVPVGRYLVPTPPTNGGGGMVEGVERISLL